MQGGRTAGIRTFGLLGLGGGLCGACCEQRLDPRFTGLVGTGRYRCRRVVILAHRARMAEADA
jgi:hypothetical protein